MSASTNISFVKLFAQANHKFRLKDEAKVSKLVILASEEDIQHYEELFADHGMESVEGDGEPEKLEEDSQRQGRGCVVETSDLEKLRATVKQVTLSNSLAKPSHGKFAPIKKSLKMAINTRDELVKDFGETDREDELVRPQIQTYQPEELLSVLVPSVNWESEVYSAMELDDDDQNVVFVADEPSPEDIAHTQQVRAEKIEQAKAAASANGNSKKPFTISNVVPMPPQASFVAPTASSGVPVASWQVVKNPAVTFNSRWQILQRKILEQKFKDDGKFWKVHSSTSTNTLPGLDMTSGKVPGLEAVTPFSCLDEEPDTVISSEDEWGNVADSGNLDQLIPNDDPFYDGDDYTGQKSHDAMGAALSLAALGPSSVSIPTASTPASTKLSSVEQRRRLLMTELHHAAEANRESRVIQEDKGYQRQEEEKKRLMEKQARIVKASGHNLSSNKSAIITETAVAVKATTKRARNVSLLTAWDAHDDALLHHHAFAAQHRNTRPFLLPHELKFFHRPHLRNERDFTAEILIKKLGKASKNSSKAVTAAGASKAGMKASKLLMNEKDRHNLSLASGDSTFIIIEYVEEYPPIMMNYGMTSAIINYYRSNNRDLEEAGDEDEDNALQQQTQMHNLEADKSRNRLVKRRKIEGRLTSKDMDRIKKSIEASSLCVPTHLQLLWELKNKRRPYDYDANIPRSEIGQTKVLLQASDPSPFLGEIEAGNVQPSLVNKLFRAPVFPHDPATSLTSKNDFLLIVKHKHKGTKTLQCIIREIPYMFLAGQCEPLMTVPRPTVMENHRLPAVEESFCRLSILRYLNHYADQGGVDLETMLKAFFGSSQSFAQQQANWSLAVTGGTGEQAQQVQILSPHQVLQRRVFEELLYQMSEAVDLNGVVKFFPKEKDSDEDDDGGQGGLVGGRGGGRGRKGGSGRGGGGGGQNNPANQQMNKILTEEEYAKKFSPEDVCLQESSNAAEYRLFRQQVYGDIEVWRIQKYLEFIHKWKTMKKESFQNLKESPAYHRYMAYCNSVVSSNGGVPTSLPPLPPLMLILAREIKRLETKQAIARYLLFHLVRAPWNTTSTFVNSVINRDEHGLMEVKKYGDPSGRGEGFAFFRSKDVGLPRKTQKRQYVESDKDLRRLHGIDAIKLLINFGMAADKAKALKRWDRIDVLRSYILDAYHKNTLQPELMKYVRLTDHGLVNPEQFKRDCQDIWQRQRMALSLKALPSSAVISTRVGDGDYEEDAVEDALTLYGLTPTVLEEAYDKLLNKPVPTQPALTLGANGVTFSLAPSSVTASQKPKVGLGIIGSHGTSMTTAGPPIRSELLGKWPEDKRRPAQAVRKIIRKIDENGVETVTISFSFSQEAILAAKAKQARAKQERDDLMLVESLFAGFHGHHPDIAAPTAASTNVHAAGAGGAGNLSISLKKMTSIVERHQEDSEMLHLSVGTSSRPRGGARGGGDRDDHDEFLPDGSGRGGAAGNKVNKSSKRGGEVHINHRTPRISFAAKLESILMELWASGTSLMFRYPVDRNTVGYYERVTNPICLSDIHEKIASYSYERASSMIEDLDLMVNNSALYNGPTHQITKNAKKLKELAKKLVDHERMTLGPEKDTIGILEEAIRKSKLIRK